MKINRITQLLPANGWIAEFGKFGKFERQIRPGRTMRPSYSYNLIAFALVEDEFLNSEIKGVVNIDGKNRFCEECSNFLGYTKEF